MKRLLFITLFYSSLLKTNFDVYEYVTTKNCFYAGITMLGIYGIKKLNNYGAEIFLSHYTTTRNTLLHYEKIVSPLRESRLNQVDVITINLDEALFLYTEQEKILKAAQWTVGIPSYYEPYFKALSQSQSISSEDQKTVYLAGKQALEDYETWLPNYLAVSYLISLKQQYQELLALSHHTPQKFLTAIRATVLYEKFHYYTAIQRANQHIELVRNLSKHHQDKAEIQALCTIVIPLLEEITKIILLTEEYYQEHVAREQVLASQQSLENINNALDNLQAQIYARPVFITQSY